MLSAEERGGCRRRFVPSPGKRSCGSRLGFVGWSRAAKRSRRWRKSPENSQVFRCLGDCPGGAGAPGVGATHIRSVGSAASRPGGEPSERLWTRPSRIKMPERGSSATNHSLAADPRISAASTVAKTRCRRPERTRRRAPTERAHRRPGDRVPHLTEAAIWPFELFQALSIECPCRRSGAGGTAKGEPRGDRPLRAAPNPHRFDRTASPLTAIVEAYG